MIRLIAILFFLPVFIQSQPTEDWLTPFATVEFKNNRIVYKHIISQSFCKLQPTYLLQEIIEVRAIQTHPIQSSEVQKGMDEVAKYLLNTTYLNTSKQEKLRFIKVFAIQTIWADSGGELPQDDLFQIIKNMTTNTDREISDCAAVTIRAYLTIKNMMHEQNRPIYYLQNPECPEFIPPLFSANRLIAETLDFKNGDDEVWPKYYGEPNRYDYSRDIMETYDKGYMICGGYFNDDFSGAWLIKISVNGDTLWEKILDCDGFNYLNAIHQSADGGFLACGAIQLNKAEQMPYILKLNACGHKEWCKSFYTPEPDVLPWAQDIKETPSGDIIVLVNTFGYYPQETMHLFKLSHEGDVIWKKAFCSGYEYPEAALPLGNSLHISSTNTAIISGSVYWEDPWNPGGPKGLRPLFVSIDSLGNENWVLPFGLQDTIYGDAFEIIELNNNSFLGAGSYWSDDGKMGLIVNFDLEGISMDFNFIDFKSIDSIYQDGVFLNLKKYDSLYIAGCGLGILSQGLNGGEIVFGNNILDPDFITYYHRYDENADYPYTLELTESNKLLSNSTFKETGNWDISLSKLNLNLEYDSLDTGTYNYDSLCTTPGQPQSGFIFLDDCELITGIDVPSPEQYYAHLKTIPFSVYPNPAKDIVNFTMENTEHHKDIVIRCFNLLGKKVFETPVITGQKESNAIISNWPQGMYVAVVYSMGLPVGECKFVVE